MKKLMMKQYTSSEQTAKLMELGLPKPKGWNTKNISSRFVMAVDVDADNEFNYSIGELIEMLPENVAKENEMPSTLNISLMNGEWCVQYADFLGADFEFCNTELVDALYDMAVKLKEDGVI